MHTFGDIAKALNRSPLYLTGLQKRFELPLFEGAAYPPTYVAFLRGVINLRMFDIAEETLRDLWHLEKKLLQLLHVDSAGSRTWFLNSCGATTHPARRLLLTNHDLGVPTANTCSATLRKFCTPCPAGMAGFLLANGDNTLKLLNPQDSYINEIVQLASSH
jgi:hypothetical protein